jgi:hypothetical protein
MDSKKKTFSEKFHRFVSDRIAEYTDIEASMDGLTYTPKYELLYKRQRVFDRLYNGVGEFVWSSWGVFSGLFLLGVVWHFSKAGGPFENIFNGSSGGLLQGLLIAVFATYITLFLGKDKERITLRLNRAVDRMEEKEEIERMDDFLKNGDLAEVFVMENGKQHYYQIKPVRKENIDIRERGAYVESEFQSGDPILFYDSSMRIRFIEVVSIPRLEFYNDEEYKEAFSGPLKVNEVYALHRPNYKWMLSEKVQFIPSQIEIKWSFRGGQGGLVESAHFETESIKGNFSHLEEIARFAISKEWTVARGGTPAALFRNGRDMYISLGNNMRPRQIYVTHPDADPFKQRPYLLIEGIEGHFPGYEAYRNFANSFLQFCKEQAFELPFEPCYNAEDYLLRSKSEALVFEENFEILDELTDGQLYDRRANSTQAIREIPAERRG